MIAKINLCPRAFPTPTRSLLTSRQTTPLLLLILLVLVLLLLLVLVLVLVLVLLLLPPPPSSSPGIIIIIIPCFILWLWNVRRDFKRLHFTLLHLTRYSRLNLIL